MKKIKALDLMHRAFNGRSVWYYFVWSAFLFCANAVYLYSVYARYNYIPYKSIIAVGFVILCVLLLRFGLMLVGTAGSVLYVNTLLDRMLRNDLNWGELYKRLMFESALDNKILRLPEIIFLHALVAYKNSEYDLSQQFLDYCKEGDSYLGCVTVGDIEDLDYSDFELLKKVTLSFGDSKTVRKSRPVIRFIVRFIFR